MNDGPIENFRLSSNYQISTIRMSTGASEVSRNSLVEFRLGPELGSETSRSDNRIRMGVRRFRYRSLSRLDQVAGRISALRALDPFEPGASKP